MVTHSPSNHCNTIPTYAARRDSDSIRNMTPFAERSHKTEKKNYLLAQYHTPLLPPPKISIGIVLLDFPWDILGHLHVPGEIANND